jgi:hypothetical protein
MRRGLANRLPALSKFYPGLMPWHVERMSLREVVKYVQYMDAARRSYLRRCRCSWRAMPLATPAATPETNVTTPPNAQTAIPPMTTAALSPSTSAATPATPSRNPTSIHPHGDSCPTTHAA